MYRKIASQARHRLENDFSQIMVSPTEDREEIVTAVMNHPQFNDRSFHCLIVVPNASMIPSWEKILYRNNVSFLAVITIAKQRFIPYFKVSIAPLPVLEKAHLRSWKNRLVVSQSSDATRWTNPYLTKQYAQEKSKGIVGSNDTSADPEWSEKLLDNGSRWPTAEETRVYMKQVRQQLCPIKHLASDIQWQVIPNNGQVKNSNRYSPSTEKAEQRLTRDIYEIMFPIIVMDRAAECLYQYQGHGPSTKLDYLYHLQKKSSLLLTPFCMIQKVQDVSPLLWFVDRDKTDWKLESIFYFQDDCRTLHQPQVSRVDIPESKNKPSTLIKTNTNVKIKPSESKEWTLAQKFDMVMAKSWNPILLMWARNHAKQHVLSTTLPIILTSSHAWVVEELKEIASRNKSQQMILTYGWNEIPRDTTVPIVHVGLSDWLARPLECTFTRSIVRYVFPSGNLETYIFNQWRVKWNTEFAWMSHPVLPLESQIFLPSECLQRALTCNIPRGDSELTCKRLLDDIITKIKDGNINSKVWYNAYLVHGMQDLTLVQLQESFFPIGTDNERGRTLLEILLLLPYPVIIECAQKLMLQKPFKESSRMVFDEIMFTSEQTRLMENQKFVIRLIVWLCMFGNYPSCSNFVCFTNILLSQLYWFTRVTYPSYPIH